MALFRYRFVPFGKPSSFRLERGFFANYKPTTYSWGAYPLN